MNKFIWALISTMLLVSCASGPQKKDAISQINQDLKLNPSAAGERYVYVCNDGSDMNSGESVDDAFYSYDYAVEQIKSNPETEGNTYLLMCKGGTFTATSVNKDPFLDSDIGGNDEPSYLADTYYIDCNAGNDSNDGQSPETAWASIDKVLTKTSVGYWDTVFPNFWTKPSFHEPWTAAKSGSTFLFKRGCTFDGFINVHARQSDGSYSDEFTFGAYGDLKQARPIINDKEGAHLHRSVVWSNGHTIHLSNLQLNVNHDISFLNIDMRSSTNSSVHNTIVTNSKWYRFGRPQDGSLEENNLLFPSNSEELVAIALIGNLGVYTSPDESYSSALDFPVIFDAKGEKLVFSIQVTQELVVDEPVLEEPVLQELVLKGTPISEVEVYGKTYGATKDKGETDEYGVAGINYSGNTYYIDCEIGKDTNDGLSADSPWLSLEKVNSKTEVGYWDTVAANVNTIPQFHEPWEAAPSGSAFLFKRGCAFDGYINLHARVNAGEYSENITFASYGDSYKARPIIKGGLHSKAFRATVWSNKHKLHLRNLQIINDPKINTVGVYISGAHNSTIEGVVIKNAAKDGVLAESTNNILIDNVTIENNQLSGGRGGGFAGGGDNLKIINSTFINNGRDQIGAHNIYVRHLHNATIQGNQIVGGSNLGIVLHGSSDTVLIKENLIEGNSNGIDVTGSYKEEEVFNNVTIEANIIRNNGYRDGEQGFALLLRSIINSRIINNLIYGNRLGGMTYFDKKPGDFASKQVLVAHNTFIEPKSSYGIVIGGADLEGVSIMNNIFVHKGENKIILTKNMETPLSELDISHNLYFMPNRADNKIFNFNKIIYTLEEVRDEFGVGYESINADPEFLDEEQFDYHLSNTSPAVNAGAAGIEWDFEGVARDSELPTLGVFEY